MGVPSRTVQLLIDCPSTLGHIPDIYSHKEIFVLEALNQPHFRIYIALRRPGHIGQVVARSINNDASCDQSRGIRSGRGRKLLWKIFWNFCIQPRYTASRPERSFEELGAIRKRASKHWLASLAHTRIMREEFFADPCRKITRLRPFSFARQQCDKCRV